MLRADHLTRSARGLNDCGGGWTGWFRANKSKRRLCFQPGGHDLGFDRPAPPGRLELPKLGSQCSEALPPTGISATLGSSFSTKAVYVILYRGFDLSWFLVSLTKFFHNECLEPFIVAYNFWV